MDLKLRVMIATNECTTANSEEEEYFETHERYWDYNRRSYGQ